MPSRVALLVLLMTGCGEDPDAALFVDLRTDYRPRLDFWVVRTELSDVPFGDGVSGTRAEDAIAETDGDYVAGRRVAELDGLTPGSYHVRVTLLDAADAEVAHRILVTDVAGQSAVTAVISASCRGLLCPNDPTFPERTECVGGQCVDPRCTVENPDACGGPTCSVPADCTPLVPCAATECIGGECFQQAEDSRCAAGEVCELARGCVPAPSMDAGMPRDAGPPPPLDAGCPFGGVENSAALCANGMDDDCDGTMDCADPDCASFATEDGPARCRDGLDNDCDGQTDCRDGGCHGRVCQDGQLQFRCCGGDCVNTFTDESHCGSCGAACNNGQVCRNGPDDHGRCQCSRDADCPSRGRWSCGDVMGTSRCLCLGDTACGADFVCVNPGVESFCRATFP